MLEVAPQIRDAQNDRRPVVALETTLIAHGIPKPANLELALALQETVRQCGAVPATIGIVGGRLKVGLSDTEIEQLALAANVEKCSTRDLARTIARGGLGATTVASTLYAAVSADIRFLATGGLGGVHPGGELSMDVSADLMELSRSAGIVVCSGPKAILDLDRTIEVLESQGIGLLGFQTNRLPGFYFSETDISIPRLDDVDSTARVISAHAALGWPGSMVVANPPPLDLALQPAEFLGLWQEAQAEAEEVNLKGGAITPFVLARLAELSQGRTVTLNKALVRSNAALAAKLAVAVASQA